MDKPYYATPHVLQPAHAGARGFVDGVDPRLRILAVAAMSVIVAAARQWTTLWAALAAALLALAFSAIRPAAILKRLLPLNALMLMLAVLLPLSTRGEPAFALGPLSFSREGLLLAAAIALKGNAIVLAVVALLGTLEAATLGHALSHLYVPDKLIHLLLFTVRYLDVLHQESLRLRAAMKIRGFRPRMDLHTYRSYGYLVGMLLVRSLDRAERIVAAMKCRGFQGRFYLLDHFALSRRDLPFAVVSLVILLTMVLLEWL